MAGLSSLMFGWKLTYVSVLGSEVFGKASVMSCKAYVVFVRVCIIVCSIFIRSSVKEIDLLNVVYYRGLYVFLVVGSIQYTVYL